MDKKETDGTSEYNGPTLNFPNNIYSKDDLGKSFELVREISNIRPPITAQGSLNNVLTHLNIQSNDTNYEVEQAISRIEQEQNIMTARFPPKNLARITSTCLWAFACGWSDAAPGALLPFIEQYYDISYSVVSLVWMANAAGFIFIALISHKIQPWFGRRYSMVVGCFLSCVMYAIVSSGTAFPAIVVGFFFGGMGLAICLAQSNIFLSRLDKLSRYLSFFHGLYGGGATISPIVATLMVSAQVKWSYFYLTTLGFMIINSTLFYWSFEGLDHDLQQFEKEPLDTEQSTLNEEIPLEDLNYIQNRRNEMTPEKEKHGEIMKAALKNKSTWILAFFVLFYQGSEVALGGWIVTYLLDYRHGNPHKVGYVESGYWAGLTVGRLFLTRPLAEGIRPRRAVIILSIISICLVLLVWVVPNATASGVLVAIAGTSIGPCYPLQISLTTRLLPRKIQVVSLTIITAFGSSGGAIFPFLVGLISQLVGAFVVLPTFMILFAIMLVLWIMLPNVDRQKSIGEQLSLWQRIW